MENITKQQPPIAMPELLESITNILEFVEPNIVMAIGSTATNELSEEQKTKVINSAEKLKEFADNILNLVRVTIDFVEDTDVIIEEPRDDTDITINVPDTSEQEQITETSTQEAIEPEIEIPAHLEKQKNESEPVLINKEVIEFTDIESLILEYAKNNPDFRLEVMRKSIPEIASLTDAEYSNIKKDFADIRESIVVKLMELGVNATWEVKGKTRGTKYNLVIDNETALEDITFTKKETTETPEELEDHTTENSELFNFLNSPTAEKLSPNEREIVASVVNYLIQHEDRQNLSSIISEVFNKSKLPRNEEARLIQILDWYVEEGYLRSYGKTYGYMTETDRIARLNPINNIESNKEDLNEYEKELLEFIYKIGEDQRGDLNIGYIVRNFFKVQQLPREDFYNFLPVINGLAEKGYIIHAEGSPWYGIHRNIELNIDDNKEIIILPSIISKPINSTLSLNETLKELKKPDLDSVKSSSAIQTADDSLQTPTKRAQKVAKKRIKATTTSKKVIYKEEIETPLTPEEMRALKREENNNFRKAAEFALKLSDAMVVEISQQPEEKEKATILAQNLSERLNISKQEARTAISNLVKAEHLFFSGSIKGFRYLSSVPQVIDTESQANRQTKSRSKYKLQENDIDIAKELFDELLKLDHVQQGLSIVTLLNKLEITDKTEKDKYRKAIRRLSKVGFLTLEAGVSTVRNSPHSRRRSATLVKIPSQEFKERLKTEKNIVISELTDLAK